MSTGLNAYHKAGTGTPTAALGDGSVYNQLDSGGAMFLRVSAAWKQILVAGGAVSLFTAGALGQVLQTGAGPVTQWSTDFYVEPLIGTGAPFTGLHLGEAITPSATNYAVSANGTTLTTINSGSTAGSTGAVTLSVASIAYLALKENNLRLLGGDASGYLIDFFKPTADVAATDLTIQSRSPFAGAVTNKNSGGLILATPAPIAGGIGGTIRHQIGGTDAFTINTTSLFTLFNGAITIETGTGAPASSPADGSAYFRNGGTNGDLFIRRNSAWVSVFTGAGFVPTSRAINTTGVLGGGGDLSADRTLSVVGGTNGFVLAWTAGVPTWQQIVNANVDAAAAIAYSKLNLATSIVNADIAAGAAIVYSKLNLSASIVNADIAAAAAIAVSKFANGTANQVLVTNGTGTATVWNKIVDANVTDVAWSKITGTPTTLGGYGITDATPASRTLQGTAPIQIAGDNAAHDLSANRVISIVNATTGAVGVIQLAQDLAGTGALPTVIALTGTASVVAMHGHDILWDQAAGSPKLKQTAAAAATTGNDFTIQAQDGGSGNSPGGNIQLIAGLKTGVGTAGQINLQAGGAIVTSFSPSKATLTAISLYWDAATGLAGLNQEQSTTGNGNAMKIIAQAAFGTGINNGGDLWLVSGAKNSSGIRGSVLFKIDTITAATFAEVSATETSLTLNSTRQVLWAAAMATPKISQNNTASGDGAFLEIVAQTTTDIAGNRVGGSIAIGSGAGAGAGVPGDVSLRTGGNTQFALVSSTSRIHASWNFEFDGGFSPTLTHQTNVGSSGDVMTFLAQAGNGSNKDGGRLDIFGGEATGVGKRGGWRLGLGGVPELTASIMIEGVTVSTSSRVVAFCAGSPVTSTQVTSGDRVMYIGNCSLVPTTPPVSGCEPFCSGGAWYVMGPSGFITQLSVA